MTTRTSCSNLPWWGCLCEACLLITDFLRRKGARGKNHAWPGDHLPLHSDVDNRCPSQTELPPFPSHRFWYPCNAYPSQVGSIQAMCTLMRAKLSQIYRSWYGWVSIGGFISSVAIHDKFFCANRSKALNNTYECICKYCPHCAGRHQNKLSKISSSLKMRY